MKKAVICFPLRTGQPDRDRSWPIVKDHYDKLHLPTFVSDSKSQIFSPSQARNAAARRAKDWDVAAFIDADVVLPLGNLVRAIGHALGEGRVTIPWDHYYSMTKLGHERGIDSAVPMNPLQEQQWMLHSVSTKHLYAPGGTVVVPREEWDRIGGYDERFEGWAFEDAAFLVAAGTFDRLSGPAYHFWHPGPDLIHRVSKWDEYKNRPITQHLVDEGRDIKDFGGWP